MLAEKREKTECDITSVTVDSSANNSETNFETDSE